MKRRIIAWFLCAALLITGCTMVATANEELDVTAPEPTETLSDAQKAAVLTHRRDVAEAYMRSMCSVLWCSEEDVLYTMSGSTLPEKAEESFQIVAGRLYRGLPYSFAGSSKSSFLELASESDGNGIYTISGLNWQMLSGDSNSARFGNDCSSALCQSWGQIGSSNAFQPTSKMTPKYGFLRVGEYTSDNAAVSDSACQENGEQVMYAAYAQLQKADALVHDGHVRMAVRVNVVYNDDGTINGEESTVTILEQTRANIRKDANYYDAMLDETVYIICGVDEVFTFKSLFDDGYQPITCKELVDPSTVQAPVVTDSLSEAECGYDTLLSGSISTNHWVIDSVQMVITDNSGKVVQEGRAMAARASSTGGTPYKFVMTQFTVGAPTKILGYIAPDALKTGNYHCKVVCRLSTEQEFTVRDFDFTVTDTPNDIHKTQLDFTAGTVHDCPMCGEKAAQWQPLTTKHVGSGNGPESGHYYLAESMESNTTYIPIVSATVCLHLNGKNITSTDRALHIGTGSVVNIMGSGTITGGYTATDYQGVAVDVSNSTANIYGGTYNHTKISGKTARPIVGIRNSGTINMYDGVTIEGSSAVARSSVLIYKGRFNMYGGLVTNGYGSNGGNFLVGYADGYNLSYLSVYGGTVSNGHSTGTGGGGNIYGVYDSFIFVRDGAQIIDGTAEYGGNISVHKGANVRITGGTVTGGAANVKGNNIYAQNIANTLTGTYLRDSGVEISGSAVAVGEIELDNDTFLRVRNGAELVADGLTVARYPDLPRALADETDYDLIRLAGDLRADVSLTRDLLIDLNGHDLTGTIEQSGYAVYGIDTSTDGYTCEEIGYFSCTDPEGNTVVPERHSKTDFGNVQRYLALESAEGWSFHRFYMGITHMSLRPAVNGVGYKAMFCGDEQVLEQVSGYGYTLWLGENGQKHSVGREDVFISGKTITLRLQNFDIANYGEEKVYGQVYLKLTDGSTVTSSTYSYTLRSLMETIAKDLTGFSKTQIQALQHMVQANSEATADWNIDSIRTYQ